MIHQSKATQHAMAAVSRLAEVYKDPGAWLSAADIAASRNLPRPVAAKTLSILAANGLLIGSPGPGGGYRLSRPPGQISLYDVAHLFEGSGEVGCPYGPGWCGTNSPCPLHDSLTALQSAVESYLKATRFDVFTHQVRPDEKPAEPAPARQGRPPRR